jgi:hypothetical protein
MSGPSALAHYLRYKYSMRNQPAPAEMIEAIKLWFADEFPSLLITTAPYGEFTVWLKCGPLAIVKCYTDRLEFYTHHLRWEDPLFFDRLRACVCDYFGGSLEREGHYGPQKGREAVGV